jgi:hypothetical protein
MRGLYNKDMKKFTVIAVIILGLLGAGLALLVSSAGYVSVRKTQSGEVVYLGILDDLKAFESMRIQAYLGDNAAKLEIARFYFTGTHVKQNDGKGAKWVECAADKGDNDAIGLMGFLYMGGIGVGQDFAKAREWLTKSDSPQAIELAVKLQTLDRAIDILPGEEKENLKKATYEAAANDMRPLLLQSLEHKAR